MLTNQKSNTYACVPVSPPCQLYVHLQTVFTQTSSSEHTNINNGTTTNSTRILLSLFRFRAKSHLSTAQSSLSKHSFKNQLQKYTT